ESVLDNRACVLQALEASVEFICSGNGRKVCVRLEFGFNDVEPGDIDNQSQDRYYHESACSSGQQNDDALCISERVSHRHVAQRGLSVDFRASLLFFVRRAGKAAEFRLSGLSHPVFVDLTDQPAAITALSCF